VYLSTTEDMHASNIRLLSLSNSVINLLQPKRHATFHVNGLTNSLIMISTIDGAAHLTNLVNCVVVLKCHQFRMHDSRDTDVYLSCSSRPIIENSRGIGFGEYPAAVRKMARFDAREEEWYVKGLVEDFNWLRKEHSPNWAITEQLDQDTWSKVLNSMGVLDVEGILDLVIKR